MEVRRDGGGKESDGERKKNENGRTERARQRDREIERDIQRCTETHVGIDTRVKRTQSITHKSKPGIDKENRRTQSITHKTFFSRSSSFPLVGSTLPRPRHQQDQRQWAIHPVVSERQERRTSCDTPLPPYTCTTCTTLTTPTSYAHHAHTQFTPSNHSKPRNNLLTHL